MDVCELEIYLQNFMCIEMDCTHNLLELIKKSMKHIKLNKLPRTSIIIITPLKLPN